MHHLTCPSHDHGSDSLFFVLGEIQNVLLAPSVGHGSETMQGWSLQLAQIKRLFGRQGKTYNVMVVNVPKTWGAIWLVTKNNGKTWGAACSSKALKIHRHVLIGNQKISGHFPIHIQPF